MSKIKIGWSEVSIVPEGRRVDLVGQFYERISGEVETPIAVSALAMECGDEHFVLVLRYAGVMGNKGVLSVICACEVGDLRICCGK